MLLTNYISEIIITIALLTQNNDLLMLMKTIMTRMLMKKFNSNRVQ
jgi:hypothetical protein